MMVACLSLFHFVLLSVGLCGINASAELRFVCKVMEDETTSTTYTCRITHTQESTFVVGEQLRFPSLHVYGWKSRYSLTVANTHVRTLTFEGTVTCAQIAVPMGVFVTNCEIRTITPEDETSSRMTTSSTVTLPSTMTSPSAMTSTSPSTMTSTPPSTMTRSSTTTTVHQSANVGEMGASSVASIVLSSIFGLISGMVGIFLCIRKVLKGRRRVLTRTIFDEDGVFQGIQHIRLHPPMTTTSSL